MHDLRLPPALRPGDTIGVCTPSAPAPTRFRAKYLHGVSELRRLGFKVVEGSLTARGTDEGHRAGAPAERAAELQELFVRPDVHAIITSIGGYTSSSLVPFLDFGAIRANPKIFCGYSDITSLHLALMRHAGLSTFYGPAVMPSFGEWPQVVAETRDSFLDAAVRHLEGERPLVSPTRWSRHFRDAMTDAWRTEPRDWTPADGWRVVRPGRVEAPALAFNLNTLLSNAGTEVFPDLDGVVLFMEEMDTSHNEAERAFRHLGALGAYERVAGLVWSRIEAFQDDGGSRSVEDLLLEAIRGSLGREPDFPIVTDFDAGHTVPMLTLGQGTPVRVDATGDRAAITVLAPMVRSGGADPSAG